MVYKLNINGNFVTLAEDDGIGFERTNDRYLWNDLECGRTTSFNIPATRANLKSLGYADDPAEYGEAMRRRQPCQLQGDGFAIDGVLSVMDYKDGNFSAVLYYDTAASVMALDGVPCADVPVEASVQWSGKSVVPAATFATSDSIVGMVNYDSPRDTFATTYLPYPCYKVAPYLTAMLSRLGVDSDIADIGNVANVLIADTFKVVDYVEGSIAHPSSDAYVIPSQLAAYIGQVSATMRFRMGAVATTSVERPVRALLALQDIELTLPYSWPHSWGLFFGTFADSWHHFGVLFPQAYRYGAPMVGENQLAPGQYPDNRGLTVSLPKGTMWWVLDVEELGKYDGARPDDGIGYGWTRDVGSALGQHAIRVGRDGDTFAQGDTWDLALNAPVMTVMQLAKDYAFVTGKTLRYDTEAKKVVCDYQPSEHAIRDVRLISVKEVARSVDFVGDNATASVRYDSEDYVTAPVVRTFAVDNANLEGDDEHKADGVSEGMAGSGDNVYVKDCEEDPDSHAVTMTAKKLTAAMASAVVAGTERLHRVRTWQNDNMEMTQACCFHATRVVLECEMDAADFLAISIDDLLQAGGTLYSWVSMTHSGNVATIVAQKFDNLVRRQ